MTERTDAGIHMHAEMNKITHHRYTFGRMKKVTSQALRTSLVSLGNGQLVRGELYYLDKVRNGTDTLSSSSFRVLVCRVL